MKTVYDGTIIAIYLYHLQTLISRNILRNWRKISYSYGVEHIKWLHRMRRCIKKGCTRQGFSLRELWWER